MKLFSNDEYIKETLDSWVFKRGKEAKLIEALTKLGNFREDNANVEVLSKGLEDANIVAVKDESGTIFTFTLDTTYTTTMELREVYFIEKRTNDTFETYNYLGYIKLKSHGYYFEDGTVLTEHINSYTKTNRYTIEKNNEYFSFSPNYQGNFLEEFKSFCSNYEGSLESFVDFCKKINKSDSLAISKVEYNNKGTDFQAKLNDNTIEEFSLNIKTPTEIVNLSYKDGNLNEEYKEIKSVAESDLIEENKSTVDSVKRLIKS